MPALLYMVPHAGAEILDLWSRVEGRGRGYLETSGPCKKLKLVCDAKTVVGLDLSIQTGRAIYIYIYNRRGL